MSRLGRGLVDLIPVIERDENPVDNLNVKEVSLKTIYPSLLQPRKYFKDSDLRDLAESIRQHGLAQPILVRETDKGYEIIAGERRFRACLLAKLDKVLVCIRNVQDETVLKLALVENLQRKNLTVFELAKGYQMLIDTYHFKQEDLSNIFNKSRAAIANQLRLLKLPDEIQEFIQKQQLGEGHARALLSLKNSKDQISLALEIIKNKLSVRQVESLIKKRLNNFDNGVKKSQELDQLISRVNKRKRVKISYSGNDQEGKFEISYSSKDMFNELLEKLNQI